MVENFKELIESTIYRPWQHLEAALDVSLTELPEEDKVEDQADEEEDDEDLGPGVQPASDEDRHVVLLQVDQNLGPRKPGLAVRHRTLHWKKITKMRLKLFGETSIQLMFSWIAHTGITHGSI